MNYFENLGIIQANGILDNSILKQLNKALLSIYFTSVDYKAPEKKSPRPQEAQSENQPTVQSEEGSEEKTVEQNVPVQTAEPVVEAQEEVYIQPEITPLELAMVEAAKKLKFGYVKDWEFRRECDAIIRFRNPLVREVNQTPREEVNQEAQKTNRSNRREDAGQEGQKTNRSNRTEQVPVVVPATEQVPEVTETYEEKINRLIATDDFIEPFDGTAFEKEKLEFQDQIIQGNTPVKVYNTNLLPGKYIAQINERSQAALRKELITIIKEYVAEWKNLSDEDILAKAYTKYTNTEKAVFASLIPNSELVPIFDIESL